VDNKIKFTMPPMAEGQTGWGIYSPYEVSIGRDRWPWHHRIIWRALMWAHNRAEDLWSQCWAWQGRFAQPPLRTETRYMDITEMFKL
jgi:hypothetical protein